MAEPVARNPLTIDDLAAELADLRELVRENIDAGYRERALAEQKKNAKAVAEAHGFVVNDRKIAFKSVAMNAIVGVLGVSVVQLITSVQLADVQGIVDASIQTGLALLAGYGRYRKGDLKLW